MQVELVGRRALVTGGSRGLGKAVARRLAESGCDVALVARTHELLDQSVDEIRAATGRRVIGRVCDLSDGAQAEAAANDVIAELGGVDILVNNAGSSFRRPLMELSRADLVVDMDLKLFSGLRLCQCVVPGMQEQRWGRIINVVSINAKAPKASSAPTTLTRAAGLTLTKVMSLELASWNILVNAICVGQIKSGQWEERHRRVAPHMAYDQFLATFAETIPLGRLGEAAEFADTVCFLASDAASYITGTAINVDGGLSPVL